MANILDNELKVLEDVKNETTDDYINCEFIPCSAAICECLWSKKDAMLPQRRSGISPVMSEQLLILNENLELWNVDDVAEALRRVQENEKIERTKKRMQDHQAEEALIADQAEAFGWGREEMSRVDYKLD